MDNTLPLISVILPVYNVEKYLKRCLNSILSQTYTNLEIILVDDGSTDQSGKICDDFAAFDSRVKVLHKHNGGASDARNKGIENARGEYFTFVDPDDEIDADYVEYLYSLIHDNGTLLSICTYRTRFSRNDKQYNNENGKINAEILSSCRCIEKMLYSEDGVESTVYCKLYHRSLFSDIRYPYGKLAQDIGTIYKTLQKANRIACGYRCKYTYWIRKNSATTQSFKKAHFDLLEMADCMTADVCRWYPQLKNAAIRYRVWSRFSVLNRLSAVPNQYVKERREIISFIKYHAEEVLHNPKAQRRDKAGIYLLNLGYPVYRMAWSLYCYIMK